MSKIAIDAHGGDNAPLEIIKGARLAKDNLSVDIVLVGIPDKISVCAKDNNIDISDFDIVSAQSIMPVEEEPTKLLKEYSDSSIAIGMNLLKNGSVDALVSAGSTGALTVGATLVVGRLKGIKRTAIGVIIPSATGQYILLDSGANVDCRPEMLQQFALMGNIYMSKICGIKSPRIGLVNIGTEKSKGTQLQLDTYMLLSQTPNINYIGNIEARDLSLGKCDVAVCDGFTGNIILKTIEGAAKLFSERLKDVLTQNAVSKIGALFLKDGLKELKTSFDYKSYGGAMLLGAKTPVIKAHGSSDAKAILNAIKQADECIKTGVISRLADTILECEV